jgi:hypothetical protein
MPRCLLLLLAILTVVADDVCVPPFIRNPAELKIKTKAEEIYYGTFGYMCQRVNRVCLDSGAVIVHDPELQRKNPSSVFGEGLPHFGVDDFAEGAAGQDLASMHTAMRIHAGGMAPCMPPTPCDNPMQA